MSNLNLDEYIAGFSTDYVPRSQRRFTPDMALRVLSASLVACEGRERNWPADLQDAINHMQDLLDDMLDGSTEEETDAVRVFAAQPQLWGGEPVTPVAPGAYGLSGVRRES
jgi:hypothetical protein